MPYQATPAGGFVAIPKMHLLCTPLRLLTVEGSVENPSIHSVHPLIHSCINRLSEPCCLLKHLLHITEDISLILLRISSVV